MASTSRDLRQKSRHRKMFYVGLAIVLFYGVILFGRPARPANPDGTGGSDGGILAVAKIEANISQQNLGEIGMGNAAAQYALFGLRPIAINVLWMKAENYKNEKDFDKYKTTLAQIAVLQPYQVHVWTFQGWNLAYNISREFDDVRDRYYWVVHGLYYFRAGIPYNKQGKNAVRLPREIGQTIQYKFGFGDDKKQYRYFFEQAFDALGYEFKDPFMPAPSTDWAFLGDAQDLNSVFCLRPRRLDLPNRPENAVLMTRPQVELKNSSDVDGAVLAHTHALKQNDPFYALEQWYYVMENFFNLTEENLNNRMGSKYNVTASNTVNRRPLAAMYLPANRQKFGNYQPYKLEINNLAANLFSGSIMLDYNNEFTKKNKEGQREKVREMLSNECEMRLRFAHEWNLIFYDHLITRDWQMIADGWKSAAAQWKALGETEQVTSEVGPDGKIVRVKILDVSQNGEEMRKIEKMFSSGVAQKALELIIKEQQEELRPEEKAVLNKPHEKRTVSDIKLILKAMMRTKLSRPELFRQIVARIDDVADPGISREELAILKKKLNDKRREYIVLDKKRDLALTPKSMTSYERWQERAEYEKDPKSMYARKLLWYAQQYHEKNQELAEATTYRECFKFWGEVVEKYPFLLDPSMHDLFIEQLDEYIAKYEKVLRSRDLELEETFHLQKVRVLARKLRDGEIAGSD